MITRAHIQCSLAVATPLSVQLARVKSVMARMVVGDRIFVIVVLFYLFFLSSLITSNLPPEAPLMVYCFGLPL